MNSIRRLKDKYEDGIKELKKEQKRKELEYLRNRNIILIISGIIEIIAIISSWVYFFKTDNSVPMMISMYVSAIIFSMIIAVTWRFQYELENGWDRKLATNHYNKRINRLKKWKKDNRSNNLKKKIYIKLLLHLYHLKWMQKITIVLGSTFIVLIIFSYIIFDSKENYPDIIGIVLVFIAMMYILWLDYFKKKQSISRRKNIITGIERKRLKFLKNLLEKEKICFDDIEKIQIIIDELIRMKRKVFPFVDINQFIIKPLIILWIPLAIGFFDYWIKDIEIDFKIYFLVTIFTVIISLGILVFAIIEPVRYLLYGKYDALIDDLRLLQIIKEEKENQ